MVLPDVLRDTIVDDLLMWLAFLGAIVGILHRKVWPILKRLQEASEDIMGVPERPGVPRRPGVMERLANQDAMLAEVAGNVKPNGGSSSHDALIRGQDDIRRKVEELAERFTTFSAASASDRSALHREQEELHRLVAADPCTACPIRASDN